MSEHIFGGEWTTEKLERVNKYLKAYLKIFETNPKAKFFTTNYVDAFAGTGYRSSEVVLSDQLNLLPELIEKDNQDFLKGSACIALDLEPPFKNYIFIEKDLRRVEELENLRTVYPNRSIRILQGNANIQLFNWCDRTDWKKNRAVVFLDPYGMQVEWSLIERIAQTKAIDLWILFPLGVAVNRLLTKSGPPPEAWSRSLTRLFGTDDWQSAFYPQKKVLTFWGEEAEQSKDTTIEKIGIYFVERLKTLFPGVAENPLPLRNSMNNPLYLLCFASGNQIGASTAVRIAQDILKEVAMATQTKIEWTEMTWNPVTGCSKVSAGCKNCYAERMAKRLQAMGQPRYRKGFSVSLHEDLIDLPKKWKQPRLVFVNSMSDLFHESVPLGFIQRVFDTMEKCPQHTFQLLTKRSGRLKEIAHELAWPKNVWMGVSVEDERVLFRIKDLQSVPANIRFISCEPLIGPLEDLPLLGIHWVIVGGESGPGARTMQHNWVDSIAKQCNESDVSFFFKQWGGVRKDLTGRELHGRTYDEMPAIYRV